MRYELFLRRERPLEAGLLQTLSRRAEKRGVHLEPYHDDDGQLRGVDLGIDPRRLDAAHTLCDLCFEAAREHRLLLFDPQAGRRVTAADGAAIAARMAADEAVALGQPVAPQPASGARAWLWLLGLVAAVLLLGRLLSCALG